MRISEARTCNTTSLESASRVLEPDETTQDRSKANNNTRDEVNFLSRSTTGTW